MQFFVIFILLIKPLYLIHILQPLQETFHQHATSPANLYFWLHSETSAAVNVTVLQAPAESSLSGKSFRVMENTTFYQERW